MYYGGHGSAVAGIFALLASTGFLVWVGEKTGSSYQKLAKAIGWIALVLSGLLVVGSLYTCASTKLFGTSPMKGCPMMQMMEEGMGPDMGMERGMERGMGPGMRKGRGPGAGMGMPHRMGPGMRREMPPQAPDETPPGEDAQEE